MAPPITLEVLTKCMTAVLNNTAKDNPNLMLDTLRDMAITVGLSSTPFTDLLIHPSHSICPPFDCDVKKDRLLLVLDNLSSPNAIKTLLYTGITLISHNDIYKWASFHDKHKIDAALKMFFKAWKPAKAYSPVRMPVDIPPTPPTYDQDTVSPLPPSSTLCPTEFDSEMVKAANTGSSLEDSCLLIPMPCPLDKGKWKPRSTPEIVCQAPVPPFLTPSLQPVTEVISPVVTTAHIRCKSQPLGEGARPSALGHLVCLHLAVGGWRIVLRLRLAWKQAAFRVRKPRARAKGKPLQLSLARPHQSPLGWSHHVGRQRLPTLSGQPRPMPSQPSYHLPLPGPALCWPSLIICSLQCSKPRRSLSWPQRLLRYATTH